MKKTVLILCICALVLVGCSSKPSKGEVKSSFQKVLLQELGSGATDKQKSAIKNYSNCVIDESYNDLSASTLKKFVDAKNASEFKDVNGSEKEKKALDAASEKCSVKLIEASK